MSETTRDYCPSCGAVPDSTVLGLHHSVDCPERTPVERGELGAEAFRESHRLRPRVRDREPADLLPLVLLELQKIRMVLNHLVDSDVWESLGRAQINNGATWEDQMKNLGHWDERYEC